MTGSLNNKPLALTMGEPAGVGPELTVRLWRERRKYKLPPFVFIGSSAALKAYDSDIPTKSITSPEEAIECFGETIPVQEIELGGVVEPGELNPANAESIIQSIKTAVEGALRGDYTAVVTNPIHKASLYSAGFSRPGHTEFLADCCNEPIENAVMMLACEGLRVVPVTVHIALADVAKKLTTDLIVHKAVLTATDLRDRFNIKEPRLAIAALNPHSGEDGAMGIEEAIFIKPAIDRLHDLGIIAMGPHAADSLFHEQARKNYDAVLCMYHDQALIPLKTIDFFGGVNITLGLPIIRTSPDHGTALPLAGSGTARVDSLLNALRVAAKLSMASQS